MIRLRTVGTMLTVRLWGYGGKWDNELSLVDVENGNYIIEWV